MMYVSRNAVAEWSYVSGRCYADPFNEVTLDVLVMDPEGHELIVPAFWPPPLGPGPEQEAKRSIAISIIAKKHKMPI